MRALIPAILAAGLISALSVAAEPLQYENPTLHYSLTMPDGWVRMPDDVLASRGQEGSGSADGPVPVAGFQQPADSWFQVPALVITHFPDKGRRPKDLFEELSHDAGLGKNGKAVVYDDTRGMVLVRELMPASDGGQINRVAAYKPGTQGGGLRGEGPGAGREGAPLRGAEDVSAYQAHNRSDARPGRGSHGHQHSQLAPQAEGIAEGRGGAGPSRPGFGGVTPPRDGGSGAVGV